MNQLLPPYKADEVCCYPEATGLKTTNMGETQKFK